MFSYPKIIILVRAPPRAFSLSRRDLIPRHTQRSLDINITIIFPSKNPFHTSILDITSRSLQILFRDLILI